MHRLRRPQSQSLLHLRCRQRAFDEFVHQRAAAFFVQAVGGDPLQRSLRRGRRTEDGVEHLGETGFGAGAFGDLFNQRGDGSGHDSTLPAGPLD